MNEDPKKKKGKKKARKWGVTDDVSEWRWRGEVDGMREGRGGECEEDARRTLAICSPIGLMMIDDGLERRGSGLFMFIFIFKNFSFTASARSIFSS